MRPDVAAAFDRMSAAAARDGVALTVNSGFRSDAEQAMLFAQNPDPQMVAPPGHSLHRCATELDLGPPSAYAWLAANATRFGFVRRYSWEPWHYGFSAGHHLDLRLHTVKRTISLAKPRRSARSSVPGSCDVGHARGRPCLR